jgi:hypothetical protein
MIVESETAQLTVCWMRADLVRALELAVSLRASALEAKVTPAKVLNSALSKANESLEKLLNIY